MNNNQSLSHHKCLAFTCVVMYATVDKSK